MPESKRLFLAIKINASSKFQTVFKQLKDCLLHEQIRWVNSENLHLTLRFLGNTSIDRIEGITKAITKAIANEKEFSFEIQNLGVFGSNYNPKVIWFKVFDDDILGKLETKISTELDSEGFIKDRQNFVPHLTIARLKKLKDKSLFNNIIEKYKDIQIQNTDVKELILYESILHKKGAEYKIIQKFNLRA